MSGCVGREVQLGNEVTNRMYPSGPGVVAVRASSQRLSSW